MAAQTTDGLDPIDSLQAKIESARTVGGADEFIEGRFRFPPLELLGHLYRGQSAAFLHPLSDVYETVASSYEAHYPSAYQPPDDPLGVLSERVRGREPQLEVESENTPEPGVEAVEQGQSTGLEAILGREVLALAGSSALSSEARQEALKRVAIALENPSRENVRAILLALIQDG